MKFQNQFNNSCYQVEDGIDDEEEVHGRDGDVVDDAVRQTPELLRMEDCRQNERAADQEDRKGRRSQRTVLCHLKKENFSFIEEIVFLGRILMGRFERFFESGVVFSSF